MAKEVKVLIIDIDFPGELDVQSESGYEVELSNILTSGCAEQGFTKVEIQPNSLLSGAYTQILFELEEQP